MSVKCRVLQSGDAFITQPFHFFVEPWKAAHLGIDLVRNPHYLDWIVAHSDGIVVSVVTWYKGTVWDGSWGNHVKIRHENGYCTLYAHLTYGTIKVKVGDKVKKGQVLGYMGSTGPSTAGHLHFEVYNKSGIRVDPEPYLNNDLPGMNKVTFRSQDLKQKEWLPKVRNGSVGVLTAGNPGHKMGAFTMKSPKMKGYCAERRGRKGFGNYITTYGVHRGEYAGNKKRAILRLAIDAKDVAYKGQYTDGTWTPTRYGKNYSLTDPKGYIGDGKRPLAQVMCWIV